MEWLIRLFAGKKNKDWKDIEYFHETWKIRIAAMARYISPGMSVIDLGSGKEWLREYVNSQSGYIAVDYMDRGTGNIVCDFNKKEFPDRKADIAFVSGCLEYVEDVDWFIQNLGTYVKRVIVSYNTLELVSDLNERKSLTWKNHMSHKEIVTKFEIGKFKLAHTDVSVPKNTIFVFERNHE